MDGLLRDLRYALRGFLKRPGFSVVAVLILAVAIGAITAMFAVVNAVLFTPLPFADADRLMLRTGPRRIVRPELERDRLVVPEVSDFSRDAGRVRRHRAVRRSRHQFER